MTDPKTMRVQITQEMLDAAYPEYRKRHEPARTSIHELALDVIDAEEVKRGCVKDTQELKAVG